jgi:hypothetical protein
VLEAERCDGFRIIKYRLPIYISEPPLSTAAFFPCYEKSPQITQIDTD